MSQENEGVKNSSFDSVPSQAIESPPVEVTAAEWVARLGALVDEELTVLASDTASHDTAMISGDTANRLAVVRLGAVAALFNAMRARHAATAAHSLRVALTSSAWVTEMGIDGRQRDLTEVAALLHDVGMMSLPDRILLKPGPLTPDEYVHVDRARRASTEILRGATGDEELLSVVQHVAAWFDGTRPAYPLSGENIPLPARVISIVEAFDAMTTDHVFRPAMSVERATADLFENAGSQFDPALVEKFAHFRSGAGRDIRGLVAQRWLTELDPGVADTSWQWTPLAPEALADSLEGIFHRRLLDQMHDGVIFVNSERRILHWNHGAERLTGIAAESVQQRIWQPSMLGMRNERGDTMESEECPVITSLECGSQSFRRLTIRGRTGGDIAVDSHTIPVVTDDAVIAGAAIILHDASSEITLAQRVEHLRDRAAKDPMTQVANRAEFDRTLEILVQQFRQRGTVTSLIICDLDRFKQVNDVFGHQAGDDAIKSLATLLQNSSRSGDLVARYGGEEFVLLCVDCDNATAARRAEKIRQTLAKTPQPRLDGRSITASFGVTEIQPGDTAETALRRADRALLTAKSQGRNTVVQLGAGGGAGKTAAPTTASQRKRSTGDMAVRQVLSTAVPISLTIEKLRGFVADHRAKILRIAGNRVSLEINDGASTLSRRASDRPVTFAMELELSEERSKDQNSHVRTRLQIEISPKKTRDRRRTDITRRTEDVLTSLRSYLMATVERQDRTPGLIRKAHSLFQFWKKH